MKSMGFQWLDMRITEEQDRRKRETEILERLPRALTEVHDSLKDCLACYTTAFGEESAELKLLPNRIEITVRDEQDGQWKDRATVNVTADPALPGFEIDSGKAPLIIEVGLLPGEKVYYRDRDHDKYIGMDELTRRILDRALFPKLGE
jgi:hypothetical protein